MTSGGYVGLSIATLLSQHHKVTAVDIIPEKVELINNKKSPIQDEYIEKYLAEKELDLTATLDAKETICKLQKPRSVATSCQDILMEYFREHEMLDAAVDGRMTILPSTAQTG